MDLYVESPQDRALHNPICLLRGWCRTPERAEFASLRLVLNGQEISASFAPRQDVETAFPGTAAIGFSYLLDLGDLPDPGSGSVELRAVAQSETSLELLVAADVWQKARIGRAARQSKRLWCGEHLRCLQCNGSRPFSVSSADPHCSYCGTAFPQQTTRALNLLTPAMAAECDLRPGTQISAHTYDETAKAILEQVRAAGGRVLDCGAGLRAHHDETVINLEITDYPSTDVIAAGQSLPFVDHCFDAVLSLNVLEHVSDPQRCAAELMRVLRPGGVLYCVVPFLQPEHAYPNHFFNMTKQGLAQLFAGQVHVQSHEVPGSGLPIWALCWFLAEYAGHLSGESQARFLELKIGDLLSRPALDWLPDGIVRDLDADGNRILACTTALVGIKR